MTQSSSPVPGVYADNAAWTDNLSRHYLVGGIYQSVPQSITDGRTAPILLDANGRQIIAGSVDVVSGTITATGSLSLIPVASGGLSIFRSLDLDETEEQVKGTAGQVYGWYMANRTTATLYVKFYNDTAANVIVGTTTPVMTFPLPGNASDTVAANMVGDVGIEFTTAITVACTTGIADADTGAPAANACVVNLWYE